ncbi:MAG: phenylacetate--CoA ligase family protein, partial [Acetivibrionales bacterium]|jgi:phenylacetate-CoA ligase
MRTQIENRLGITAYDIYGLSEIMGPGVAMNCRCQEDLHIISDHFIAEIIDPETEQVLPEGSKGELVFTCITKEALPLIRYRTRDLSVLTHETCACGRTSTRMAKVTGRSDDMLIIRGVNVFPSQIESVLLKYSEVEPHYMIYVDRVDNLDIMEIQIEMNYSIFSDQVKKIESIERKLRHEIESTLGISAKIKLVEPNTIQRSEGKAKRVIDKRKLFNS